MVGDRFRRRLSKAVGLSEGASAAAFPLGVSFSNFPPSLPLSLLAAPSIYLRSYPSQRSASHCSCVSCRDNRRKSILVSRCSLLPNRHHVTTNIEIHSLIFHPIQFAQIRSNFFIMSAPHRGKWRSENC